MYTFSTDENLTIFSNLTYNHEHKMYLLAVAVIIFKQLMQLKVKSVFCYNVQCFYFFNILTFFWNFRISFHCSQENSDIHLKCLQLILLIEPKIYCSQPYTYGIRKSLHNFGDGKKIIIPNRLESHMIPWPCQEIKFVTN